MSRLLPATLAVAALLLGAIVWELQDVARPDPATPAGRSSAVPVTRAAPEAEPGDVLQGWVATALERPLFRADRRPPKSNQDGEAAWQNGHRVRITSTANARGERQGAFFPMERVS
jgi:hypothetical protein